MLRHEVIVKIKREFDDREVDARLGKARALAMQIPVVQKAAIGRTASKEYRVAVFAVTVADETALFRLQLHHLHATIAGLLQAMAEDISVSDVLVDELA